MIDQTVRHDVARDMTAVFRNIPDTRSRNTPLVASDDRATRSSPGRTKMLAATIPLLLVMLLAGFSLYVVSIRRSQSMAATTVSAAHPRRFVFAASRYRPLHAPDDAGAGAAVADRAAAPGQAPTTNVALAPPPRRSIVTVQVRPTQIADVGASGVQRAPIADSSASPARQGREATFGTSACAPHSPEDRCIYADVLRADRRLYLAYQDAVRVGLPPAVAATVNRRWRSARSIATERPDEAIRRYDDLTDMLGDYAADGGS